MAVTITFVDKNHIAQALGFADADEMHEDYDTLQEAVDATWNFGDPIEVKETK